MIKKNFLPKKQKAAMNFFADLGGNSVDDPNQKNKYTKEERALIREYQDELQRTGDFYPIYPNANYSYYK